MTDRIERLLKRVEEFHPGTAAELEEFRIKVLGRKGELNELMDEFKTVAPELKRELGQRLNGLKNRAQERINELKSELEAHAAGTPSATLDDMTRPGTAQSLGSRHPISLVRNEICGIFERLGYVIAEGPEIEDDWHVFSALNFPPEHPARDMQDTFFIEKDPDILLRTHTSSIQVRTMETQKPPIRVVCPGRVFRNEAISYRAHCIFHQIEDSISTKGLLRRHETVASLLRTGVLRPGDENTFETLLLPLHGALGGDGHLLQPLRREGVQRLQTYRMARNHGMRHGGPERTRSMRHRQQ